MRFFTDHYFTEEQKAEMLGSSYDSYVKEQQRKLQLEQERQVRLREIEFNNLRQELEQQDYDRKSRRIGLAILACIILAALVSGFGMSSLLGGI